MAYYYSTLGGFYESHNKEEKLTVVEGILTYMWQRDAQPRGQYHIYHGVEIGLNEPTEKYYDPYSGAGRTHASSILSYWEAHSKDIVFLDMGKTFHCSVIQDLVNAYHEGRLKLGTRLRFEFFEDKKIPKAIKGRWNRTTSIRVFIDNSDVSEPIYYSPNDFYLSDVQPMIDDIYANCCAKYETR